MNTENFVYHIRYTYSQIIVMVKHNNRNIAFMHFSFKNRHCRLELIRVEEEYRGMGIATNLLHILENTCVDNSVNIIDGRYYPQNENAVQMYKNHGYTIYQDGYEKYLIKLGLQQYDLPNINFEVEDLRVDNNLVMD